jgi:hypothetical protein
MSHLRHGGCVFLIPDAYLDMQKSRKSTRNGPILPHRLAPKMDKVELSAPAAEGLTDGGLAERVPNFPPTSSPSCRSTWGPCALMGRKTSALSRREA